MFVHEDKLICAREKERERERERESENYVPANERVEIKMFFSKQVKMCKIERER